jgi:hypothetical protein
LPARRRQAEIRSDSADRSKRSASSKLARNASDGSGPALGAVIIRSIISPSTPTGTPTVPNVGYLRQ